MPDFSSVKFKVKVILKVNVNEKVYVMKTRPEVSEADPQKNKSNTYFWSVQNKSWKYIKYSNIQTSVIYRRKAYTICEKNVHLRILNLVLKGQ